IIIAAAGVAVAGGIILMTPDTSPLMCVYGPPVDIEEQEDSTALQPQPTDTVQEPEIAPEPQPCMYGGPMYYENDDDSSGR
ncbi:MAG: hypothetical protein ACI4AM_08950, partial [Muribaculaceae bacterium]